MPRCCRWMASPTGRGPVARCCPNLNLTTLGGGQSSTVDRGQVQPPLTSFWGTASMGCFQASDMCARFRTAEEERQDQRRMRLLPMRLVRRIFHTHTPDPDETTGADRVPRLAPLPHRSFPTLPAHVRAHPPTPYPL